MRTPYPPTRATSRQLYCRPFMVAAPLSRRRKFDASPKRRRGFVNHRMCESTLVFEVSGPDSHGVAQPFDPADCRAGAHRLRAAAAALCVGAVGEFRAGRADVWCAAARIL